MKEKQTEAKLFFNSRRRYVRLAVYSVLLAALGIFMLVRRIPEALLVLTFTLLFVLYELYHIKRSESEFIGYVENLEFCLNSNTRETLLSYPAPLVITDVSGHITWYNEGFRSAVGGEELFGEIISEIIPELKMSAFIEEERSRINIKIGDNHYEVWGNVAKHGREKDKEKDKEKRPAGDLIVLYFIDKTEEIHAKILRDNEKMIECIITVDNYDEVLKETPDQNHGALLGEIEQNINSWVSQGGGVSRKYERDKFIAFFSNESYRKLRDEKFSVLESVRSINRENKIPVTLSIGVGAEGANTVETDKFARLAVDMALGRGGDQTVVKSAAGFSFYGAKTREVEKRTKVKARVVAHALRDLIDHSDRVIIMGHKQSDMDSVGAAIGLYRAVKSRGKDAFIVTNRETSNAKALIDEFRKIEEYNDAFISGEQSLNIYDHKTLVIIVDVHRPMMVECTELLKFAQNIVLIDHHRRSEDFIENAALTYHEPYASSSCEMITEILQYIQDGARLAINEAEALYAGIFMDTKGFTFKTGVRTFEAASYLRRMGVDPVSVRRLFKLSLESYVAKADIIRNAKVYRNNIAISHLYKSCDSVTVTVAQAADELLNIEGIEASFVLAEFGGRVMISGRSLDSVNVQVILEKLGGGGHITIAGAQLEGVSGREAEQRLIAAIDEVLSQQ